MSRADSLSAGVVEALTPDLLLPGQRPVGHSVEASVANLWPSGMNKDKTPRQCREFGSKEITQSRPSCMHAIAVITGLL